METRRPERSAARAHQGIRCCHRRTGVRLDFRDFFCRMGYVPCSIQERHTCLARRQVPLQGAAASRLEDAHLRRRWLGRVWRLFPLRHLQACVVPVRPPVGGLVLRPLRLLGRCRGRCSRRGPCGLALLRGRPQLLARRHPGRSRVRAGHGPVGCRPRHRARRTIALSSAHTNDVESRKEGIHKPCLALTHLSFCLQGWPVASPLIAPPDQGPRSSLCVQGVVRVCAAANLRSLVAPRSRKGGRCRRARQPLHGAAAWQGRRRPHGGILARRRLPRTWR